MKANPKVRLSPVTWDNMDEVIGLSVSIEQGNMGVPSNLRSLADAFISRLPIRAYAIYADDIVIGFIMYAYNQRANTNHWSDNSYFIWRFMIDEKYQGKGYGRQAITMVINEINTLPFGHADWIFLSTDPVNHAARHLYKSLGFADAPLRHQDDDPWMRRPIPLLDSIYEIESALPKPEHRQ